MHKSKGMSVEIIYPKTVPMNKAEDRVFLKSLQNSVLKIEKR